MPLSPPFILPAPCTFMTSHPSRSAQPLPGVRELFPDLFRSRPTVIPPTSSPSMIYDPQQHTPYDVTNPLFVVQNRPHLPLPDWPTAQNTAINTSDQPHRYTRVPPSFTSHEQPHTSHPPTQRWPNPNPLPSTPPRSASPELPSPHPPSPHSHELAAGPSSLPDHEHPSSPMTSPPHTASASTQLPPQSASFQQRSLESHSTKKRHRCNVCGSYWGRPSSLKIHMVSHTGEKQFVCSICKQDFGVKSNYTRHIRVHHKDSSEGVQTRAGGRRRRGSRRTRDAGPVRFVDEGPKFQGQ